MSIDQNFEFNEYTNIFLKFVKDLFIDASDDISEILIFKSENIVFKSIWNDSNVICIKWMEGKKYYGYIFTESD